MQSLDIIKNVIPKSGTDEPSNALESLAVAVVSPMVDGIISISVYYEHILNQWVTTDSCSMVFRCIRPISGSIG